MGFLSSVNKSVSMVLLVLIFSTSNLYAQVNVRALASASPVPSLRVHPKRPTPPPADHNNESITPSVGLQLDTCFSPQGGCDQKLIQFISGAKSTLQIAIYSITHPGISQAIIDAKNRGIKVQMVVDKSQSKGVSSRVASLQGAGIDLKIGNFSGIMHDKFTIVDGSTMETGSFNYTENATHNNGENQLYLNDSEIIRRYQANFDEMYQNGLSN